MKILQVIAPSEVGGAEQVVLDLSLSLARAGAEIHLAPILGREENHSFLQAVDGAVRVHPIHLPPRAYGQERARMGALLAEIQPDVVHTHGYRADVVDGPVARAEGIPTVSTVHGFTGGGLKNRVYEFLQRRAQRSMDAVVAVSRPLSEALIRGGVSRERVRFIPNARAVPSRLASPAEARRRLDAAPEAFHIGWIGRMSLEKGLDLHLDALSRLPDLDFEATIIGDGRDREALETRALELGLSERVRWAGVVPDAATLLPAFDVLVVSSRSEGTPMVVLEAMAIGIPLVVTRVGGIPDLLTDDEAILVPPESSTSLAEAVQRVYEGPDDAADRAAAARRRFHEIASTERWAQAHLDLYQSLRNGSSGAAVDAAAEEKT